MLSCASKLDSCSQVASLAGNVGPFDIVLKLAIWEAPVTQYALHPKGVSAEVAIKGDVAEMMRRGPGALNLTSWVIEEIDTTLVSTHHHVRTLKLGIQVTRAGRDNLVHDQRTRWKFVMKDLVTFDEILVCLSGKPRRALTHHRPYTTLAMILA